jgi:predicted alpha/beta superfamily hydrolase
MKPCLLALAILSVYACHQPRRNIQSAATSPRDTAFTLYSPGIKDSFYISVRLPEDYDPAAKQLYPVIYTLDANVWFQPLASANDIYPAIGMFPHAIMVGIGYKNFETLDSLRCRDYTYPAALPEYEMAVSGGADSFLAFLRQQLVPMTDRLYRTDTANRVLYGHSLGGYFTMYAMQRQMSIGNHLFHSFIAASPSLNYDHYYLLNELKKIDDSSRGVNLYVSFGSLEDAEDADMPGMIKVQELVQLLPGILAPKIRLKALVHSNLQHMETPIPAFIKGAAWCLGNE